VLIAAAVNRIKARETNALAEPGLLPLLFVGDVRSSSNPAKGEPIP